MRELPTGTVTFLFTDVEGSTKLLHELGADAYADALAEHRRVIREACAAEGGVEVDTQGDAFFFAFPTAPGAVAAAAVFTRGARAGPDPGTGWPAHRHAAPDRRGLRGRRCAPGRADRRAGARGQVVLSRATAELASGEPVELGEHRLKDIADPVSIYQLGDYRFPRSTPSRTRTSLARPARSSVASTRSRKLLLSCAMGRVS